MTEHPTCHMCEHWERGVCSYHSKRVPGNCRACIYGHARPEYRTPAPKKYKRVKLPAVLPVEAATRATSTTTGKNAGPTAEAAEAARRRYRGAAVRIPNTCVDIDPYVLKDMIVGRWTSLGAFERTCGFRLCHELRRGRISPERLGRVCKLLGCERAAVSK